MRTYYLVWIVLCLCCMIAAACVSMIASQPDVESGMNDLMSTLSDECAIALQKTHDLNDTMVALNEHGTACEQTQMIAATTRVCDSISKFQSDVSDNAATLKNVGIALWAIFCIVPLLGIISWASGRGVLSIAMVVGSWILLVGAWLLFGFSYWSMAWMDDTCVQMQLWYDCQSPAYFYDKVNFISPSGKCSKEQLTLATSGALSNQQSMCPDFAALIASYGSSYSSGASSPGCQPPPPNYWQTIYDQSWWKLYETIKAFHLVYPEGPSFGIQFPEPGSAEDPIYCQKSPAGYSQAPTIGAQGSSCVYAGNGTLYNNVTALRKLMYDTEGAHYDSVVKACSTLYNTSTAGVCKDASDCNGNTASAEHDFSDFSVKDPTTYDNSCVSKGYCPMDEYSLFKNPSGLVTTINGKPTATLTNIHCHEKAILVAADAMWEASWMSSCAYLTNAAEKILKVNGPCDTVGDAFVYSFFAWAFASVIALVLILVGYISMHAFEKCNYAENKMDSKLAPVGAGFNNDNKVPLEVEFKEEDDTAKPSALVQDAA